MTPKQGILKASGRGLGDGRNASAPPPRYASDMYKNEDNQSVANYLVAKEVAKYIAVNDHKEKYRKIDK